MNHNRDPKRVDGQNAARTNQVNALECAPRVRTFGNLSPLVPAIERRDVAGASAPAASISAVSPAQWAAPLSHRRRGRRRARIAGLSASAPGKSGIRSDQNGEATNWFSASVLCGGSSPSSTSHRAHSGTAVDPPRGRSHIASSASGEASGWSTWRAAVGIDHAPGARAVGSAANPAD